LCVYYACPVIHCLTNKAKASYNAVCIHTLLTWLKTWTGIEDDWFLPVRCARNMYGSNGRHASPKITAYTAYEQWKARLIILAWEWAYGAAACRSYNIKLWRRSRCVASSSLSCSRHLVFTSLSCIRDSEVEVLSRNGMKSCGSELLLASVSPRYDLLKCTCFSRCSSSFAYTSAVEQNIACRSPKLGIQLIAYFILSVSFSYADLHVQWVHSS